MLKTSITKLCLYCQNKAISGPDMDHTLENDENQTELPKYRPPDDHNTDKMEPKPDDDQNQTPRSQRRHNTPNYSILAGKPLERKQNKHHHQTHQNGKDKGDKKTGKKCVACTKHRKELQETKKENKHLKDTIRKAGTTERDLRNQFKELDLKTTIENMKAQLEDNEQTIKELSEETETMKTENNELRQEKETLKAEI